MNKQKLISWGVWIIFAIGLLSGDAMGMHRNSLVENAGFEIGSSVGLETPFNWGALLRATADGRYGIDSRGRSGNFSYRISGETPNVFGYLVTGKTGLWEIRPGARVRVSVWVKGERITSGTGWMTLHWLREDGTIISGVGVSTGDRRGNFEWTEFVSEIVSIPADARNYQLQLGVGPAFSGTIWFDDISMESEQPLAKPIPARGLVAHWNFDEMGGNIAHDLSGNLNHGTIVNPNWQAGFRNGSLRFGPGSHVRVPHSRSLRFCDHVFTIEAWIRIPTFARHEVILTKGPCVDIGEYYIGTIANHARLVASPGREALVTMDNFRQNMWHHLAISFDGRVAQLYLDGEFWGIWPYSYLAFSTAPLWIGLEPRYGTVFNGYINELKIYNVALDRETIRNNFRQYGGHFPIEEVRPPQYTTPSKYVRHAVLRPDPFIGGDGRPTFREDLYIYLHNPETTPLEISQVIINGRNVTETRNVAWHVVTPSLINPGEYGQILIRYLETRSAPMSFDLQLRDSRNNTVDWGRVSVENEPFFFRAMGFSDYMDRIYLYLRPKETMEIQEVLCNGKRVEFWSPGVLEANKINPVILYYPGVMRDRGRVFIEVRTTRGRNSFFARVMRPFFATGMARTYRSTLPDTPEAQAKFNREWGVWADAYRPTFRQPNQPYASTVMLDDCRRRFINTILPDYMTWPATTQPRDVILGYLRERDLRLIDGYWPHAEARTRDIVSYPGTLYFYIADEPQGLARARSLVGDLNVLHRIAPDTPVSISFCVMGSNPYDYTFIDAGYFATFPIGAAAEFHPWGLSGGMVAAVDLMAPKPAGFFVQVFRSPPNWIWPGGWRRFPTPEEGRLLVYTGIAKGAEKIIYFCYNADYWEPVDGVGQAAMAGVPEAIALWEEIGRINLELLTIGPWLTRGCVLKTERGIDRDVVVSQIGVGRDTLIYVLLNIGSTRGAAGEFIPPEVRGFSLVSKIPPYLNPADAFVVSSSGITPVGYNIRDNTISIADINLRTNKLIVVTADTTLRNRMQERQSALIRGEADGIGAPLPTRGVHTPSPAIGVTPASLAFGDVTVGTTSDLNFTVTNTGGGTLTGTASVPAGDFTIHAGATYSIPAGATHIVTVRFVPTATGFFDQTVSFTSNGGDLERTVSGVGVDPVARVIISIPDVTAGARATGVVVPVNVDEAKGIAGFDFTVTFNPAIVQARKAKVGEIAKGWLGIPSINNEIGEITLGAFAFPPVELPAGSGRIAKLIFDVVGNPGDSTPLTIAKHSFSNAHGVIIPSTVADGSLNVVLKVVLQGDLNNDGVTNIADIIICLRMALGLPVTIGAETHPSPYPDWLKGRADMNIDGRVNIADVILALRRALGLVG